VRYKKAMLVIQNKYIIYTTIQKVWSVRVKKKKAKEITIGSYWLDWVVHLPPHPSQRLIGLQ